MGGVGPGGGCGAGAFFAVGRWVAHLSACPLVVVPKGLMDWSPKYHMGLGHGTFEELVGLPQEPQHHAPVELGDFLIPYTKKQGRGLVTFASYRTLSKRTASKAL